MSDLSILCITRGGSYALPFIKALGELQTLLEAELILMTDGKDVQSAGYIESVLDQGVQACTRAYVLRLDDDERCSRRMIDWLGTGAYEAEKHWKFPRAHLWGDEWHMLYTPHLWPDFQTRLSWKEYAGGRTLIHAGSPHGGGNVAPCAIEHHKFLIRSLEERRQTVDHYDGIQPGAGSAFRAFSTPEDFYPSDELAAAVRPWGGWEKEV